MKICNVCGKEFEVNELTVQRTEDGTEYCICSQCENEGVEVSETTEYHICKQCGYPHQKDEFSGICKFCEQTKEFERVDLTQVEEEMLDSDPQKLYKEKLGDASAKKIAEWIESPQRKEVGVRHRRDRLIDTASVVGIILGYILLELSIRNYSSNKNTFLALIIPTVLVIVAAPIFKKIDRKPRKKPLPIWSIYIIMAVLIDIYVVIAKVFA